MGEIGHFDAFWDFGFRFFGCADDVRFAGDQRSVKGLFCVADIEAFAVLACGVEEEPPEVRDHVRVVNLDMAAFDGE